MAAIHMDGAITTTTQYTTTIIIYLLVFIIIIPAWPYVAYYYIE